MLNVGVAYLLWLPGLFLVCGLHRFYAGKHLTGILWFLTLGLFGVGQLFDLFLIPSMIAQANGGYSHRNRRFGGNQVQRRVTTPDRFDDGQEESAQKDINHRFLPPIPDGMKIYESDVEVAGIQHHRESALAFVGGTNHALTLEWEPDNPHDINAIKILGFSGEWQHVGYLPAALAAQIHGEGLWGKVLPRLRNIWVSSSGYVIIRLDVLGPKTPRTTKNKK